MVKTTLYQNKSLLRERTSLVKVCSLMFCRRASLLQNIQFISIKLWPVKKWHHTYLHTGNWSARALASVYGQESFHRLFIFTVTILKYLPLIVSDGWWAWWARRVARGRGLQRETRGIVLWSAATIEDHSLIGQSRSYTKLIVTWTDVLKLVIFHTVFTHPIPSESQLAHAKAMTLTTGFYRSR